MAVPNPEDELQRLGKLLQKGLPPQYQKMLEEYYKKLGKGGGRK